MSSFYLSTAIHIVAHVFNVEFFIDSHLSKDMLVQRLNSFEDEGSETYLNPIRDANTVSVKDRSYLLGFVMNFIETKDSDKVYFVSLS